MLPGRSFVLALCGGCSALACAAPLPEEGSGWQAGVLSRHSRWLEWDVQGRRLLSEQGTLSGVSLGWQQHWGRLRFAAEAQWLQGARDYAGQTNLGAPLTTRSDLREQQLRLALSWPEGAPWQGMVGLQPVWLQRDLRSTSTATGYKEDWQWTAVEAGLRGQLHAGAGRLTWEAVAGLAVDARMQFTLPGIDRATVEPRKGRQWRLGASYQQALAPGWRLSGGLQWQHVRFDASDPVPLTRQGTLYGAAAQPRTEQQDWTLRAGLETRWP